jgi:predicted LPLAT superfamily acyltransferase
MRIFFYKYFSLLSKLLGPWILVTFIRLVATGYFILCPRKVWNSIEFYRILFPNRRRAYYLYCTWRQFHNFADVFFDRILLREFGDVTYTSEGLEHLEDMVQKKVGGILMMSHMGNWEIAAYLLRQRLKGLRLLLYMGIKHKEKIERIQKESIAQSGIRIIAINQDGGSPLDILEGVKFLNSGGLISLAGDLIWRKNQRTVTVKFLGHETEFPETPHLFGFLSGAPLFIFFAFRKGKRHYHFSLSKPIFLRTSSREERAEVIRQSAQKYAETLEKTLHQHPFQWYHFEPFLGVKSK